MTDQLVPGREPVLCYVDDDHRAWFTTAPLAEQCGDDWGDANYEHNAGEPYEYQEHDERANRTPWRLVVVVYDAPLMTPAERAHGNSRYSVKQINRGAVAWLQPDEWSDVTVVIPAGTPLSRFVRLIEQAGGCVYATREAWAEIDAQRGDA